MSQYLKTKIEKIKTILNEQSKDTNINAQESDHVERMQWAAFKRFEDENNARNYLTSAIFTITVIWMFFILMIVLACGKGNLVLSDTVIVTLITTTTANVFGFMYIVSKYLFNENKST